MELEGLVYFFESSPAVRLLRAQQAPVIVRFLFEHFVEGNRISTPHSELSASLSAFQERLHESHPEVLTDRADHYLADWSAADKLWLHRFLEAGRDEPLYQLTPATQDVLHFLDRALGRGLEFVGTESRLTHVIEMLERLAVGASDDPTVHLDHLRAEQRRIEQEIARIEEHGEAASWSPTRVREHFALAVSLLKELQRDFRAVEETFKQITREVQKRLAEGTRSRGGILEQALDAEDELKQNDQGVSFYEFFRLIQSPTQQERLRDIARMLADIEELKQQRDGLETVRRMIPSLLGEANQVTRTERRLSATLRRLLDVRAQRERQRIAELLRDIRQLAAGLAENPPTEAIALEVDERLEIRSPLARTFWREPPEFEEVELTEAAADDGRRKWQFDQFAALQRVDFAGLRRTIEEVVGESGSATLAELVRLKPDDTGMIELLAYLQIASEDGHLISDEGEEEIELGRVVDGRRKVVTVPLVRFLGRQQEGTRV